MRNEREREWLLGNDERGDQQYRSLSGHLLRGGLRGWRRRQNPLQQDGFITLRRGLADVAAVTWSLLEEMTPALVLSVCTGILVHTQAYTIAMHVLHVVSALFPSP